MEKKYNPLSFEQSLYDIWEKSGYFQPTYNNDIKNNYCIMIPPPNITGFLHMGHAFQHTLMDVLIRYNRMQGKNTLWKVGTDHAGIATQIIVEKNILYNNNSLDYDRNAFIKTVWKWEKELSNNITYQMKRLGYSVDWKSKRFTLDYEFSHAVREAFIILYNNNFIFKGKRLVNWDIKLKTAISDLEVENKKVNSTIWYIRYPILNYLKTSNIPKYIIVATTRPETIFGDVAIAINPNDKRYINLVGQYVTIPILGRNIPIIADNNVNIDKGTGCVKVTPAHDFCDYEIGNRHCLPIINIFTKDGKIIKKPEVFDYLGNKINNYLFNIPDEYQGLESIKARYQVIHSILKLGLLDKEIKSYVNMIPFSNRSNSIIEPMLTDQWYIRTKKLVKVALEAVKKEKIIFIPKQYENMYFSWMNDAKDWCISRQIWWGHRIPVWYDNNNKMYVGHTEEEIRLKNNLHDNVILYQETDVLDTWFSSGLWTFASLGWPKKTKALEQFHPTNVIISGFDLIFFWIARMIMLTMYFIKDKEDKPQIPFKHIYITGLIRDCFGKKMSKSKGNVIDPLDLVDGISLENLITKRTKNIMLSQSAEDIIKQTKKEFPNGMEAYGADALRFTLVTLSTTTGRNIYWDTKRLKGNKNFCNKLWNASRFVIINTEGKDCGLHKDTIKKFSIADLWIISKLNETIKEFREKLDSYRFDLSANILYEFIWNQFCDWYIEVAKIYINNKNNYATLIGIRYTLIYVLESLLRLAHPIIPFITEAIWQELKIINHNKDSIMIQSFPNYDVNQIDKNALFNFELVKKFISIIRIIRAEINFPIKNKINNIFLRKVVDSFAKVLKENLYIILKLINVENIIILSLEDKYPISIVKSIDDIDVLIPISDNIIYKEYEICRLTKEIDVIEKKINNIYYKFNDIQYMKNAPKSIIEKDKIDLKEYKKSYIKLKKYKSIILSN